MPRAATETKTKTATRTANAKTTKAKSGDGETKTKRAPSAYNIYMGEHLKKWKENNPSKPIKEGMASVAAQWRDAPENPKRGQQPAAKKAPKAKAGKENTKKPKAKKKEVSSEEDEDVADDDDEE